MEPVPVLDDPGASEPGKDPAGASIPASRRLVATWDGESFRPVVPPEEFEPGQRVVLEITVPRSTRELAGRFAACVGTLSHEEAEEMQRVIDEAFETISDEW